MYSVQLFVVAAFAVLVGNASSSGDPLTNLCKGKSFELNTVGDLYPLIHSLKSGQAEGCSEAARGSVLDLEPIIMSENVCSIGVAQRIGQYYEKYVSKKSKFYWKLSKSVREYFLAISFEISRLCEKTLIERLAEINGEGMSREDALIFRNFNMNSNNIPRVIGGQTKPIQDLFVVTKMDGLVMQKQQDVLLGTETISVSRELKRKINRMRAICQRSLEPIYEKMFTPLIMLTNFGFEYNSNEMVEKRNKFRQEMLYQNWFVLIIMCESTLDLNVIERPESSSEVDKDSLTILERDDVDQLERETGLNLENQTNEYEESPRVVELSVRLDSSTDLTSDELRKEVKSISKRRQEAKSERKQVLDRLAKHFDRILKSTNLKVGLREQQDSRAVDKKMSWKLKVAMLLTGAVTIVGLLTNPIVFIMGVGILMGLILTGGGAKQ